jgi:hypothetical protein
VNHHEHKTLGELLNCNFCIRREDPKTRLIATMHLWLPRLKHRLEDLEAENKRLKAKA